MTGNDYSELDYDPKEKKGFIVPALIIISVIILLAILIVFLLTGNGNNGNGPDQTVEPVQEAVDQQPEVPGDEAVVTIPEQSQGVGGGPDGQEDVLEEEMDRELEEEATAEESAKDLATIETTAHEWLKIRTEDPDVIMVTTSDLDDIDAFYEQYSLSDDNILVYMVDSVDDEFLTVIFGPPYSEWGLKAVFIWRNNQWEFLREEDISM